MKTAYLNKDIFTSKLDKVATREGYGDGVVEIAKQNNNVVVLCADLTQSTKSEKFKKVFPNRFFEMGVAEQNMAGVAAGLALSGKVPFMSSYATFSPGRNWDQIRVSICYSEANVKIVGAHAGLSVGPDGATHQALEDVAITRVLPNIVILNPCDYEQARKATIEAVKYKGPVYLRLAREATPVFTSEKYPFEIGKANVLMEGKDVTLISSGPILYEALKAARELSLRYGIGCDVIDLSTIKPLDEKTIIDSARKTGRVITLEEHQVIGGSGSAVAELLSQQLPTPMMFLGVKDSFGESGHFDELWEKYGINAHHVEVAVKNFVGKI